MPSRTKKTTASDRKMKLPVTIVIHGQVFVPSTALRKQLLGEYKRVPSPRPGGGK
jgi:hypothetical protein